MLPFPESNSAWNELNIIKEKRHRPTVSFIVTQPIHYNDVIISTMVSQITSLTIIYSAIYSGTDQRKHQSSASLALVRGIHRWPVNSPHKGPVTWKMFPFDDVIMRYHMPQYPHYWNVTSHEHQGIPNYQQFNCLFHTYWPFWGESTSDQWIPLMNGQ